MTPPAHILVVIGSPIADSFTHALASAYVDAARTGGAEVRVVDLSRDTVPQHPAIRGELRMPRTSEDVPLPDDVAASVAGVAWADHLVFFFPQWWGAYPAAMKAYIDRVFLSGFAFRYRERGSLWDKLLTGRTARIVMTMDSPRAWNAWMYRDAAIRTLRTATLEYCGVRVRGVTRLAAVRHSSATTRERWLRRMAAFGAKDARGVTAMARDTLVSA
ncbi:NAD(P)H-dependent oxidoreductase [uncultured Microbacterium sp.]|uniref:NAD(P)H-dependent oxidoreductase n=1 Tax=uncultured Microbacterium sp. TaxID=191216 RepID=UPI00260D0A38|nr:NAD(P)H-dependent oxidoreductase [uncultured Microbacterium sp.]